MLHLTATATTVSQGGRVVFTVTAEDEHGNPVDPAGAVLSSSVVTDVIDGLAVTFASPGTHVITAALGGLTANVTVDVVPPVITVAPPPPSVTPPTPPRLPATGNSAGPLVRAATLMLAFGALAALATRRHVRS